MLKTRLKTAVVSLVILGAVLFVVPAGIARLVIAAVIIMGAWEWSGFLGLSGNVVRFAYVAVIAALMAVMSFVIPFPTPIPAAVRWLCGVLVLVPLFVALLFLYSLAPQYLLFALLIVWAADMGAYFAGKQFGRVKLAPGISPGKTWEGVFGGLLMVVIFSLVWAHYADLQVAVLLPFCLAVGAVSVVGDLTVSMFKRTAGVKDSGRLFPGHGGVLDRVDSVAAAAPLFALGLTWLGLVA